MARAICYLMLWFTGLKITIWAWYYVHPHHPSEFPCINVLINEKIYQQDYFLLHTGSQFHMQCHLSPLLSKFLEVVSPTNFSVGYITNISWVYKWNYLIIPIFFLILNVIYQFSTEHVQQWK